MDGMENAGAVAPDAQVDSEVVENTEETSEQLDATEDLEAAESNSKDDTPTEKEIKKAIKRYELQVNGRKKAIELDLDNEDEVKRYLSKAMAADEKFQEAA